MLLNRTWIAAVLSATILLGACHPNPTSWKTHDMTALSLRLQPLFENTKTVCFGRFLIDVPATAEVVWGPASIPWDVVLYPDGTATLDKIAAENIARMKATRNIVHYKPLFMFEEEMRDPPGKIVTGYADFESVNEQSVDVYYSLPPYGVHIKSSDFINDPQGTSAAIRETARRLRTRPDTEIPAEPGQCVEHLFLPDKPGPAKAVPDVEHVRIGFRLKEFPDVHLSIYVAPASTYDPSGDSLETTLRLTRADARKEGRGDPYKGITFFREDKRQIHDWLTGYEVLTRTPDEEASHAHDDFWLKFTGVGNDVFRPFADIQFKTGVDHDAAGATKSSLTDAESIALWNKLTGSIRVRRPSDASPKPAGATAPPKTPLGARESTGTPCPHAGWWQCMDEGGPIVGGRRRHFMAGEPLPHAVLFGPQTLWQKLKGEPKQRYDIRTIWTLVADDVTATKPMADVDAAGITPSVGTASAAPRAAQVGAPTDAANAKPVPTRIDAASGAPTQVAEGPKPEAPK